MTITDFLIASRESLLSLVTPGTAPAINARRAGSQPDSAQTLAVSISEAIKTILVQYMDQNGNVDYEALRASQIYDSFKGMTAQLRTVDPAQLGNRAEKLAFWINIYNTLILDAVITFGVQTSVAEKMWGIPFFRAARYEIGGMILSIDDIEHCILRQNRGHPAFATPQFRADDPPLGWVIQPMDPRIHFAINCASRSCPPVRAYDAGQVEQHFDLATRNFLSSDENVRLEQDIMHLSHIFSWFGQDYGGRNGIIAFIARYLDDALLHDWLLSTNKAVRLRYRSYDWRINQAGVRGG